MVTWKPDPANPSPAPEQPRAHNGRFDSHYLEPRGEAIALRLPKSLDTELRQTVGWASRDDNPALKAWVEAAIAEKLQRDRPSSPEGWL